MNQNPATAPRLQYQATDATSYKALKATPNSHTMGKQNFLKYIGRYNAKAYEINSKKFTALQAAAIVRAFREDLRVRVFSAPRHDMDEVALSFGFHVLLGSVMHHHREEKPFNNLRSSFCFVKPNGENSLEIELWVFTFPSRQYVDQIGELISAIIDSLATDNGKKYQGEVTVWHFPKIEDSLAIWTGFDGGIKSYIRHGDVVAIGNIELFLPSLIDAGFRSTTPDWTRFGINKMFSVKILVDDASSARIALIGIHECFWGEASSHYVKSLISAGARHILYGSKAASLVKGDAVHEVISPNSFVTISSESNNSINLEPEHKVIFSGAHQAELNVLLKMFGIHQGGLSVTVPTVIGETHKQREAYEFQNPACMDCENGHIAQVVQDYDKAISNFSSTFRDSIKFVPVHFITDYIYRMDEATNPDRGNLAESATERRDVAFRKIGFFFAIYALKYGRRERVQVRSPITSRGASDLPLESVITEVRPFLDFGYGRETIAVLLSLYRQQRLPATILLAVAMVSQKYGYSEIFFRAASELKFGIDGSGLNALDSIRLKLFHIKHLTQVGDYDGALDQATKLSSLENLRKLREIDQYCAFQRRLAICFASKGDKASFVDSLANSETDATNQGDRKSYQDSINILWRHIGILHLSEQAAPIDLSEVAKQLSQVRKILGSLESKVWWQTNFEKGALAALFLEAAFFLQHGNWRQQSAGLDRLFLASLLNVRIGGHEQSEAYGEIVAGVPNVGVREALLLAMDTDTTAQTEFQNLVSAKNPSSMGLVHKCLALLHSSPSNREGEMQKVLLSSSQ